MGNCCGKEGSPALANGPIPASSEPPVVKSTKKIVLAPASESTAKLAVKLYHKISEPNKNLIFSPLSIALALALAEMGADGETREEIRASLCLDDGKNDAIDSYQTLQDQLQYPGTKVKLCISNGFFCEESFIFKPDFMEKIKKHVGSEVKRMPFRQNPDASTYEINQWISNATAGKLPNVLQQGSITNLTVAVIANAIYMKAPWDTEFKTTTQMPFYQFGKTENPKTVRMPT
jgi:serine protease inhibitor